MWSGWHLIWGNVGDLAATQLLGLILSAEWMSSSLLTAPGPTFLEQRMAFYKEKNWAPVKEITAHLLQLLCNHCPSLYFQLTLVPSNSLSGHLVLPHTGSRCWQPTQYQQYQGLGVHMKQNYVQWLISQEHWHIAFQAWGLRRPHYSKIWNEKK